MLIYYQKSILLNLSNLICEFMYELDQNWNKLVCSFNSSERDPITVEFGPYRFFVIDHKHR